jgi:two-component system response regulator GlrR
MIGCLQPKENLGSGKEAWQILVVDDEPAVCGAIKMMLEYDGHKVQTANNGREALSLLEQGKFDLVTTDFFMTGMKGDALAAAIKERLPNQPVLMISANGAIAKSSGDKLPGVDMVLSKPFLLEDLRNAIDYFKGKRPSSSD